MEATSQSQRDISSILDTVDLRENSNSLRTASKSTDFTTEIHAKEGFREINTLTGSPRDPEFAITGQEQLI